VVRLTKGWLEKSEHVRIARDEAEDGAFFVMLLAGGMDQVVDVLAHGHEGGVEELVVVTGAWDGDFDHFAHATGVGIEHEDAVAEEDGFIEVVGDEDDGDIDIFPDVEEVGLHLAAGLGIECAEGFVHEEDAGLIGEGAMATRCFMPPESC
jgi:hypothetical protein